MNGNRQIVTFPFKPHLAQYLFNSISNTIISTEEAHHRTLDINLNSPHGQIIRLILKRADYPGISEVKKGFSLTVTIPRYNPDKRLMEDGRYNELIISEEAIDLINTLFQIEFENHLMSYIAGRVASEKRGGLTKAIQTFVTAYNLGETEFSFDRIRKMYHRANFPLKSSAYEKKAKGILSNSDKTASKTLLERYLK
jgi:hypothetical protein